MAAGLPDYTKVIRPRYGAAKTALGVVRVAARDTTKLIEVKGRGMIYGGIVHLTAAATQKTGRPGLHVDGEVICVVNFYTLNLYNIVQEYAYPLSLIHYDEVNYRYAVGINFGFTFEESFKVDYEEKEGARPFVVCRVCYALI